MNTQTEPVGAATTLSAVLVVLVNAFVAMATSLGWVQWDSAQQATINGFVVALVNVGAIVGPMLWARSKVTPLAKPTDETGAELVRKVDGLPTRAAQARGK